jgi:hypothetical protein
MKGSGSYPEGTLDRCLREQEGDDTSHHDGGDGRHACAREGPRYLRGRAWGFVIGWRFRNVFEVVVHESVSSDAYSPVPESIYVGRLGSSFSYGPAANLLS